jgi:hypothetical protein
MILLPTHVLNVEPQTGCLPVMERLLFPLAVRHRSPTLHTRQRQARLALRPMRVALGLIHGIHSILRLRCTVKLHTACHITSPSREHRTHHLLTSVLSSPLECLARQHLWFCPTRQTRRGRTRVIIGTELTRAPSAPADIPAPIRTTNNPPYTLCRVRVSLHLNLPSLPEGIASSGSHHTPDLERNRYHQCRLLCLRLPLLLLRRARMRLRSPRRPPRTTCRK